VYVAVFATDTYSISTLVPGSSHCITRTTLHLARKRVTRPQVLMLELHFLLVYKQKSWYEACRTYRTLVVVVVVVGAEGQPMHRNWPRTTGLRQSMQS
jgi:hypothetical protein